MRVHNVESASRSKYVMGCRCAECRKCNAVYIASRARKLRPLTLTSANPIRIAVLKLLKRGWVVKTLAERLGITAMSVYDIREGRRERVSVRTAGEVLLLMTATDAENSILAGSAPSARRETGVSDEL